MIIDKNVQQYPFLLVTFTLDDDDLQFNEGVVFSLTEIANQLKAPVEGLDTDSEPFFHLLASGFSNFRQGDEKYRLVNTRQVGLEFSNHDFDAEIVYIEQINQDHLTRLERALLASVYTFPEE